MAPEDNGWSEYRRLFLDDRDQNRAEHIKIFEKLEQISTQLTEIRTEREQTRRWTGPTMAAVVAAVVTGAAKAFGF